MKDFWPYVIPVSATSIGRVSGYIAMSHVVSSCFGTVEMAAQQILLSFFLCLTPICDSLNLTAQSFLPSIFEKRQSKNRAVALKQTVRNFIKAGALFGAVLVGVVMCIPFLSKFFTVDSNVISLVTSVTPLLAIIFALSGVVCTGEGLLLGQKDLKFLGRAYSSWFFIVPYFMFQVKKRALSGMIKSTGVLSVWKVFVIYQIIRCSTWLLRLGRLQKRIDSQVNTDSSVLTKTT
uniref:Polysaccharide biosynthesis protein C-terminal domain-containing protein n=1 Tax=Eucampia antarctica TaxID=49252 RepID=A0A7S2WN91_9STRA|mmetsp:Transcript_6497/g.6103  ORF Transcript_6497/g.6103 Transcript_6497/m.6103 type:complete len:234 (+) Transcript_6497:2-703(+)